MLDLGQTVMTRGIAAICEDHPEFMVLIGACLHRHESGDWGDLCEEDKAENDRAVAVGDRVMSAYKLGKTKIWIITEWNRSVTTVLLPDEY